MTIENLPLATGAFDPVGDLSPVACDYLKAIWNASEWDSARVTTTSVARHLGVAASTASTALRRLTDRGLITHERYGSVDLTDPGTAAAARVVRRQRLLETYLVDELGYGWHEVHDDADLLAHAASDRLIERIDQRLGQPVRDPHGDPIPSASGAVAPATLVALATCSPGDRGVVGRIADSDPAMLQYLAEVGLIPDAVVTVRTRRAFAGTLSVAVQGRETEIVLGDVAASAIWIDRTNDIDRPVE
ncbi:metal-dependent transcriptional regulator [Gordonia sp. CPCC 206044]|uniref:metal-dependent transcriptional regulator n=1 Tax=Gordonia sp. CPCC 206044 TaxID=3140793 RepID=UPI003AF3A077